MSRFDEREIQIAQLEDELVDISYINAVMQEALEMIASNTEEDRRTIAQETLESIIISGCLGVNERKVK